MTSRRLGAASGFFSNLGRSRSFPIFPCPPTASQVPHFFPFLLRLRPSDPARARLPWVDLRSKSRPAASRFQLQSFACLVELLLSRRPRGRVLSPTNGGAYKKETGTTSRRTAISLHEITIPWVISVMSVFSDGGAADHSQAQRMIAISRPTKKPVVAINQRASGLAQTPRPGNKSSFVRPRSRTNCKSTRPIREFRPHRRLARRAPFPPAASSHYLFIRRTPAGFHFTGNSIGPHDGAGRFLK